MTFPSWVSLQNVEYNLIVFLTQVLQRGQHKMHVIVMFCAEMWAMCMYCTSDTLDNNRAIFCTFPIIMLSSNQEEYFYRKAHNPGAVKLCTVGPVIFANIKSSQFEFLSHSWQINTRDDR